MPISTSPMGQQAGYVPPQVNNWQSQATPPQPGYSAPQPYQASPQPAATTVPPTQETAQQAAQTAANDVDEARAVFSSEQLPSFDEIQKGMGVTESVSEVHRGDETPPAPDNSIRHAVEEQAESASEAAAREVEAILSSEDPFAPLSTGMPSEAEPAENKTDAGDETAE